MAALVAVTAILGGGCARTADLEPAADARLARGRADTAVDRVAGVRVSATDDGWEGLGDVSLHVTPLRVRVENDGERPVRIRYGDFAAVSTTGVRYSALPPVEVDGTVDEPRVVRAEGIVPAFDHRGFHVAPYYGPVYSALRPVRYPFAFDPLYYGHYYRYWQTIGLPTPRMLELALPEGVVDPGGAVTGWIYLEWIDPDAGDVVFRMDLVDPRSGKRFGEIQIPFDVRASL